MHLKCSARKLARKKVGQISRKIETCVLPVPYEKLNLGLISFTYKVLLSRLHFYKEQDGMDYGHMPSTKLSKGSLICAKI